MRHRKRGRVLGRSPAHRKALLRNLASALFLTERTEDDLFRRDPGPTPKVPGRIITTLPKAKEVRPLVEKCITIARRSIPHQEAAAQFAAPAERNTEAWRAWRQSPQWHQWAQAIAPVVAARRRVLRLLGDKRAMRICFEVVAPRFADRPGGYTRILRLATPRLGDAGARAILEFVGQHDRVRQQPQAPAFEGQPGEQEESAAAPATGSKARVGRACVDGWRVGGQNALSGDSSSEVPHWVWGVFCGSPTFGEQGSAWNFQFRPILLRCPGSMFSDSAKCWPDLTPSVG